MKHALYTYQAEVERVIDGDTLDVKLDLGLRCYRRERIRVLGIDAPETRRRGDVDRRFEGFTAKAFLELIFLGTVQRPTQDKLEELLEFRPDGVGEPLDYLRAAIKMAPDAIPLVSRPHEKAKVVIRTERGDAFGRWLGWVWLPAHNGDQAHSLRQLMVELKLAEVRD